MRLVPQQKRPCSKTLPKGQALSPDARHNLLIAVGVLNRQKIISTWGRDYISEKNTPNLKYFYSLWEGADKLLASEKSNNTT